MLFKYTTFINIQITSSTKSRMMHPAGISQYFTFDSLYLTKFYTNV